MSQSYYVKKPGKWFWGNCYTLPELRAAVASGQVGQDWIAGTGAGKETTVSELISQPDLDPEPVTSEPVSASASAFTLPPVEESGVALALSIIAALELIAAPIAGFAVGSDNALAGWMIFLSGLISGLILFGFARVIGHTSESSQRLRRIEMLIKKAYDDKDAA